MPGESPFGIPRSLLRLLPEGRAGEWTLRLGDVPLLARHCPRLMERGVPVREVQWAAGILARDSALAPCAPRRDLRGEAARDALEKAQDAVARAMAAGIPVADDEEDGPPSGLGWWLHLCHFALAGLHLGRAEAMEMPVGELFALGAANARSLGFKFGGPTYGERDVLEELEAEGPE